MNKYLVTFNSPINDATGTEVKANYYEINNGFATFYKNHIRDEGKMRVLDKVPVASFPDHKINMIKSI